jgi:polysaccharide export outer membrane protein
MRLPRLLALLWIGFAASGCAHAPTRPDTVAPISGVDAVIYGDPSSNMSNAPAVVAAPVGGPLFPVVAEGPPAYTLDSGDRLRITVFGQDGLSNSYFVDVSGNITMPLIGAVAARGLTTQELSRAIGERLKKGFIREPHVAIEVEAYRPFFILGEVTAPGQYPYVPNMTAETAVAIAGGFTPRAFHGTIKLRRNEGGQVFSGIVPLAFPVRPGDTITIQERWF